MTSGSILHHSNKELIMAGDIDESTRVMPAAGEAPLDRTMVATAVLALFGISAGIFLAVDWALMTDIIPKASSGRYMGLSNVATASSGVLAVAIGGTLMDLVGGPSQAGSGPRAALVLAVLLFFVGAGLLRSVDERRREDVPLPAPEPEFEPEAATT